MWVLPAGALRRPGSRSLRVGAICSVCAALFLTAWASAADALVHSWSCATDPYVACWDVNEYHSWKTISNRVDGASITVNAACAYAITSNNGVKAGSGCSTGRNRLSCIQYPFDPYSRPYTSWQGPNQTYQGLDVSQAITASEATC
jgi:hypothetical protein